MRVLGVAALALLAALSGCGTDSGPAGHRVDASPAVDHDVTPPPPLTLRRPEGIVDLHAWSWCLGGGCATGEPPDDPAVTAAVGQVAFYFPLDGWVFDAGLSYPGSGHCGRTAVEQLDRGPDGTYVVRAPGAAGTWDVTVTGYSGEGGSLSTTFRWRTSEGDPGAEAVGDLGFLWPPRTGGREMASPPTLAFRGLAKDPPSAEAELTLPGLAGAPTYRLHRSHDDCPGDGAVWLRPEGSLVGEVPLPRIGETQPVEVHVFFDDDEYVGTAVWPADLHPRNSNRLRLTWEPSLPAWDGSP